MTSHLQVRRDVHEDGVQGQAGKGEPAPESKYAGQIPLPLIRPLDSNTRLPVQAQSGSLSATTAYFDAPAISDYDLRFPLPSLAHSSLPTTALERLPAICEPGDHTF